MHLNGLLVFILWSLQYTIELVYHPPYELLRRHERVNEVQGGFKLSGSH